ncbi:hypothetical protein FHW12_000336 [Dokdonella fugitiva]|uniref:Lipoprotein n=1 Tax=Dokdonella fugitiva TaxID=328517 RepID=A0A839EQW8_9GAMM|nr:hypothetical protein [Dokdonella fugitiva]MBA8886145.1 hypothetical protein [Dokdonella fugitiva]
MKRNTILAAALVAGCAHQPPIVKHEVVRVPVEVRVPLDPVLTADTLADPPPAPACTRKGQPAYCNGQVAAMLDDARLALGLCNADKRALRSKP